MERHLFHNRVQLKAMESQMKELEKVRPTENVIKEVPQENDHTLFVDDLVRERDRQVCENGKQLTTETACKRGGGGSE